MVSQNQGNAKGGRPEALVGPDKLAVRKSFAKWLASQVKKHDVSHMTIRRAIANTKKGPSDSTPSTP